MRPSELKVCEAVGAGLLRVASDGRVWRHAVRTRVGRLKQITPVLADEFRRNGYRVVRVGDASAYAHRVVWFAAHGPVSEAMQVNHKNGIKWDNRLENLELLTPGDNQRHAYAHLNHTRVAGELNGRHKLTADDVEAIRSRHAYGATGNALAREYGVSKTAIRKIIRGELWRVCPTSPSEVV